MRYALAFLIVVLLTSWVSADKTGTEEPEDSKAEILSMAEGLNKIKAELDKELEELTAEKQAILKEKDGLGTPDEINVYNEKAARLNERIRAYDNERKDYEEKARAFNARVREESSEEQVE